MQHAMSNERNMKKMLCKVPQITLFFWIIKVLCTTTGETFSDFLSQSIGLGLIGTSVIMGVALLIVIFFQFKAKQYIPWIYWLTVVLISVFGTLITDIGTDKIGISLEFSTVFFSILLLLTFFFWYRSEKTLSIHSIFTRKREMFYWLTILFTFALGTASGDLISEGLGMGYFLTGLIVCAVIIIFAVVWYFGLNEVLSFWVIYIMTRPLGASIGDLLSQPKENGGLGLGATITSVIFLIAILGTVAFLSITKKDVEEKMVNVKNDESKNNKPLIQTIIVISLFIVVSIFGYTMRTNYLAQEARNNTSTNAPLGNMSKFITLEQGILDSVNKNDFNGARNNVTALETAWDDNAAVLKATNKAKWTEIDGTLDDIFSSVRTANPDKQSCIDALNKSMATMK